MSASAPCVSVVIPCYNGAAYVAEAIESALAQTYPNLDVIVVDDGSTDDSLRVIRAFGDRIRWEGTSHGGACAARNRGAEIARGEFLQFLDADDLLYREKIEQQMALLQNGGGGGGGGNVTDSVFCDTQVVRLDGSARPKVWKHARHQDPVIAALGSNAGTTGGLHRREAFFSIGGFRTELVAAQERDFHLRLACAGKSFRCLDRVLWIHRRHDDSISSDHLRVIRQYENILVSAYEQLVSQQVLSEIRARAFSEFMARAARMASRLGDHALADRYFAVARSMHRTGGLEGAYGRVGRVCHRSMGPRLTTLGSQWMARVRGAAHQNSDSAFGGRAAAPSAKEISAEPLVLKGNRTVASSFLAIPKSLRRAEFRATGQFTRLRRRDGSLREHIEAVLGWILRAQQATPDDGVAEGFYYPSQQWRASYPETTGYIICSLLRAARAGFGDADVLKESARRMGEWLAAIQLPSGAFQGGTVAVKQPQPAVFNTGQILKGLTDLCTGGLDATGRLATSANRAAQWLIEIQDADGAWRRAVSSLTNAPTHAYKVRTAWALARYGRLFDDEQAVQAGIKNAEWLLSTRQADDWFPLMNFDVGADPLLHTIAYTVRGLLELGVLCQRAEFVDAAQRVAGRIARLQNPRTGAIPGQLAEGYRPVVPWTSTTSNSQMAVVWFRLAAITGESHWADHARQANAFNRTLHEIDSRNPGTRGAVRGSWPGRVGYGRYSYLNWTQKFFLDALLAEAGVVIN